MLKGQICPHSSVHSSHWSLGLYLASLECAHEIVKD
jgi:hypothetical protein